MIRHSYDGKVGSCEEPRTDLNECHSQMSNSSLRGNTQRSGPAFGPFISPKSKFATIATALLCSFALACTDVQIEGFQRTVGKIRRAEALNSQGHWLKIKACNISNLVEIVLELGRCR